MPTFSPLNHSGKKRPKRMHNAPKVDVDNPPPVLLGHVEKCPRNPNPSVGHNKVNNPMLGKHMIGKPLNTGPIRDIKLKSTP